MAPVLRAHVSWCQIDLECLGPHGSIVTGRHTMAPWTEMAIDEHVSGEERLRLGPRLEASHLTLAHDE
jgi:hypothetical protein